MELPLRDDWSAEVLLAVPINGEWSRRYPTPPEYEWCFRRACQGYEPSILLISHDIEDVPHDGEGIGCVIAASDSLDFLAGVIDGYCPESSREILRAEDVRNPRRDVSREIRQLANRRR